MYPHCGFFGVKHVQDMQAALDQKIFPDLLVEREKEMSKLFGRECCTMRFEALGMINYFTTDPDNIKAMLATQFEDYDLGPARRGNMIRTLGDGIVSLARKHRDCVNHSKFVQDGRPWEHSRALLRVSIWSLSCWHNWYLLAQFRSWSSFWSWIGRESCPESSECYWSCRCWWMDSRSAHSDTILQTHYWFCNRISVRRICW